MTNRNPGSAGADDQVRRQTGSEAKRYVSTRPLYASTVFSREPGIMMFIRPGIPTGYMVTMDALIDKSDRCAKLAEELGLEEDASTYRKGNRLYKELKDDLARIGEKV